VDEGNQEYGHPTMRGVTGGYPRSMYRCCGYTDEELRRPLIGVVTAFFEAHPGSRALMEQVAAVKAGPGWGEERRSNFTPVDLDEAGGVRAVLKELSPHLDLSVPWVTGQTLGE